MLTDEQRDALNEAICLARDDGLPGTEDHLRALLAAHSAGAQEPVAWMRSYRQFSDTQSAAPDPGHMVTSFHQNAEFAAKYPDENTPLYAHPHPMTLTNAARDVLAERQRQISEEGAKPEEDDAYKDHELARAAIAYARSGAGLVSDGNVPTQWPWMTHWWKPSTPRRDLVKAAALLLAEIERLDRAKGE